MTKVRIVCTHCGGENITIMAYMRWDINNQKWKLSSYSDDQDYCEDCENDTRAMAEEIIPPPDPIAMILNAQDEQNGVAPCPELSDFFPPC